MSNIVHTNAVEMALIKGDLSALTPDQRLSYFKNVCESLGLNPLTKPFEFINLNGKLTFYAKRDATDQLRKVNSVSITIASREKIDDVFIVTARAKDKTGREDESVGAVNVAGLKGDALANAFMKAETKAKRRVTLSICGLGLLDESEVADIPIEAKEEAKAALISKAHEEQHGPGDHVAKFGKFKGQKLQDLDIYELNSYVDFIEKSAQAKGKAIQGDVAEFMRCAVDFLKSKAPDGGDSIPF